MDISSGMVDPALVRGWGHGPVPTPILGPVSSTSGGTIVLSGQDIFVAGNGVGVLRLCRTRRAHRLTA